MIAIICTQHNKIPHFSVTRVYKIRSCNAVCYGRCPPTFRSLTSPPSSGSKRKSSEKEARVGSKQSEPRQDLVMLRVIGSQSWRGSHLGFTARSLCRVMTFTVFVVLKLPFLRKDGSAPCRKYVFAMYSIYCIQYKII
jgi:hypothetical protein